jgi:phage N-6-adenine-methyltransferase
VSYTPRTHPLQTVAMQAESLFPLPPFVEDIDDRRTPREYFAAQHALHAFTVDAAANDANHLLPRYWTREDSGLQHPWHAERVWCNPPYSDIEPWVAKAHESRGLAVLLLPANRTEQGWWQRWVEPHRDNGGRLRCAFVARRMMFGSPDPNKIVTQTPFGCVLLTWRTA